MKLLSSDTTSMNVTTTLPREPLLELRDVSKSFGGVRALRGAHLDLFPSEVLGLIGENGAGKSTLIKIMTGAHQPDQGLIRLFGRDVEKLDPLGSRRMGIAPIYQQPALFSELSVEENIAMGLEPAGLWRRIDWRSRRVRAQELLDRMGANFRPETLVRDLSMPQQQLVEIARALGANAKIVIMDEPTSSLSENEVENLFRVIREMKQQGVGIIYVTHRLEELSQIADRVTVLRDGEWIETRTMAEVDRATLIRLMVGRELSAVFPKRAVRQGDIVLKLNRVGCRASQIHDVSFEVRAGEIVGLAGLVGAGRTELARVLFGITLRDEGEILLNGRAVSLASSQEAIAAGIAYVPEDRRRHGVILEMPVDANISLASLEQVADVFGLNSRRETKLAQTFVDRMSVKTDRTDRAVATLSGGNQQKVSLGRWLATNPKVLILDEPTQGIDVGAKSDIHRMMCDLAEQGLAIIMISSELDEVLGMSDRIVVLHQGRQIGTLTRNEATAERVMSLALGHREAEVSP